MERYGCNVKCRLRAAWQTTFVETPFASLTPAPPIVSCVLLRRTCIQRAPPPARVRGWTRPPKVAASPASPPAYFTAWDSTSLAFLMPRECKMQRRTMSKNEMFGRRAERNRPRYTRSKSSAEKAKTPKGVFYYSTFPRDRGLPHICTINVIFAPASIIINTHEEEYFQR